MLNVDPHNLKALYIYGNEFMVTTISSWTSHYLLFNIYEVFIIKH